MANQSVATIRSIGHRRFRKMRRTFTALKRALAVRLGASSRGPATSHREGRPSHE